MDVTYLYGFSIVCFAALVQGITGFGFALLAVPLMSVFMLPKDIVPIVVIFGLIINTILFIKKRLKVRISDIKEILIYGVIGIPFGVYLLNILSPQVIKVIAGALITFTSIALMIGWEWKGKNEKAATRVAGFLSGLLNGSTSMSGPPIVLFLIHKKAKKDVLRAYLPLYGILTNLITLFVFAVSDNLHKDHFVKVLIYSPGMLVGLIMGILIVNKISESYFRLFSLFLMLGTGIWAIILAIV